MIKIEFYICIIIMLSGATQNSSLRAVEATTPDSDFINKVKIGYTQMGIMLSYITASENPDILRTEDKICLMLSSLLIEAKCKKYKSIGKCTESEFSKKINSDITTVRQYFMIRNFTKPINIDFDTFVDL